MNKTIAISDGALWLVLARPARGMPEILAFGAGAKAACAAVERAPRVNGLDAAVPSVVLLPTGGMGFFGWPAIAGHRDGRDFVTEFADWRAECGSDRCVLRAEDALARLGVEIRVAIEQSALSTSVSLVNRGDAVYPLERLETQRGARLFIPPEVMGAHVSTSPNHQTQRRHSPAFRAVVALAYHFGVEVNLLALGAGERAELAAWIALHKRLRSLLHDPQAQFDLEPQDGRYVWGAASAKRIVVIIAQGPTMQAEQPAPLRLPAERVAQGAWRIAARHPPAPEFLRTSAGQSRLLAGKLEISGASLVAMGLPLPMLRAQSGIVLELERVAGA